MQNPPYGGMAGGKLKVKPSGPLFDGVVSARLNFWFSYLVVDVIDVLTPNHLMLVKTEKGLEMTNQTF